MNETTVVMGIVRTMDDLGRVVIPKEIRRAMNIAEGDSIDILSTSSGSIILRKVVDNTPIGEINSTPKEKPSKIISFEDCNGSTKIAKITPEMDRFLDWLIENDYINCEINIAVGYPDIEDFTK